MKLKLPNERAYDAAAKDGHHSLFSQKHCCICGREVSQAYNVEWLLLTREADAGFESAISHPDDATGTEPSPSEGVQVWVQPIGHTCLKKHPELKPFVLPRP